MSDGFSIRELTSADAAAFHAVRLAALVNHPEAFGSSADDWRAQSLAEVEERLRNHSTSADQFMLGAFHGDTLVGITGLFRETRSKLRHKAGIVSVYVAPEWRRLRVAARLFDESVRLAGNMSGLLQLQLSVGTSNEPAIELYQSRGFTVYGIEKCSLLVEGTCIDLAHMQKFLKP